jgi:flagellar protein FlaG
MVINLINNVAPASIPSTAVEAKPPSSGAGNVSPHGGNEPPQPPAIGAAGAIDHLLEFISNSARGLRFSVDPGSGDLVVTVVNPNSGQVIRQIPSEEMLQVANALRRYVDLHLVDEEA